MITRLLAGTLLVLTSSCFGQAASVSPTPSSSEVASPKLPGFKERLAAAKTVKVQTSILGLELNASLEEAHRKLDPLTDAAKPAIEAKEDGEAGEREHKVVWPLAKSDFSSVFVKTDEERRITYITGFLRPGKEMSFNKIGEVAKAPIASEKSVAWDVVRPEGSLLRVVARGTNSKAASITIFIVKQAQKR